MRNVRDVRVDIAEASVCGFHIRIIAIVACVMMFDGYDNFVPAYVIHWTKDAWNLSLPQAGMLMSSGLIGFMVGAIANGPIADRIGRKPTLVAALIIAGSFSVATALFARSFESFVVTRVLTGLGLGVLLPLATTYMNEFMPRKVSNVATIIATGSYTVGGMLAGVAGVFLTPAFGWESLFLIGACAIPMALICIVLLPESPLYLVCAGRSEKASETLRLITPQKSFEAVTLTLPEGTDKKGSITQLFNLQNRRNTILIWVIQIVMLFDAYVLIGWTPTVMINRGETFASGFLFGSLLQIMSLLGGLACGYVADKTGSRRLALSIWWLGGVLSLIGLAVTNTHLLNMTFVALCGFTMVGPLLVLSNLTAQLFETEVRGTAVGMSLGIGRIGGILGPVAAGWVQQSGGGVQTMFLAMATICVVGVVAVRLIRPENGTQSITMKPASAL